MGIGSFKTSFDYREKNLENERKNLLMFSFEGIEAEIKVWELIKSFNYSDKSFLFKRKINVDNILKELYEAKEKKKVVEIQTRSLFINYMTEEERKKLEEKKRLEKIESEKKFLELNREIEKIKNSF